MCIRKLLKRLFHFGVDRLVYIACKPTSLARDIEVFQKNGYHVKRIACVDLFPSTYHIETICEFAKMERFAVKERDKE